MTTLPAYGSLIRFSDLSNVFGGTKPTLLSDYYSNKPFTSGISGIPTSGLLLLSGTFGGKSKTQEINNVAWTIRVETATGNTYGSTRIVSANVLSDNSITFGGYYTMSNLYFYNGDGTLASNIVTNATNGGYFLANVNNSGVFKWATRIEAFPPTLTNIQQSTTFEGDRTLLSFANNINMTFSPFRAYSADGTTFVSGGGFATSSIRGYTSVYSSNGVAQRIQALVNGAGSCRAVTTLTNSNIISSIDLYTTSTSFPLLTPGGATAASGITLQTGNTTGRNLYVVCSSPATGNYAAQWWMSIAKVGATDEIAYRFSNGIQTSTYNGFAMAFVSNSSNVDITTYPAGSTTGSSTFPLPVPHSSATYDGYIIFVNNAGVVQWVSQIKGQTGHDYVYDVTISTSELLFACGTTSGVMSVVQGDSTVYTPYIMYSAAGYVICTNLTGITQWLVRIDNATPQSVTIVGSNVVVTGRFTTSVVFYVKNTDTPEKTLTGTNAVSSIFVAVYSQTGSLMSASVGKGNNNIYATSTTSLSANSFIVAGSSQSSSFTISNFSNANVNTITNNASVPETAFLTMFNY